MEYLMPVLREKCGIKGQLPEDERLFWSGQAFILSETGVHLCEDKRSDSCVRSPDLFSLESKPVLRGSTHWSVFRKVSCQVCPTIP